MKCHLRAEEWGTVSHCSKRELENLNVFFLPLRHFKSNDKREVEGMRNQATLATAQRLGNGGQGVGTHR